MEIADHGGIKAWIEMTQGKARLFIQYEGEARWAKNVLLLSAGMPPAWALLRRRDVATRIKEILDTKELKRAVIVGGGYIGLEMAEAFVLRGLKVSLSGNDSPGFKLCTAVFSRMGSGAYRGTAGDKKNLIRKGANNDDSERRSQLLAVIPCG
jgi:hypothetical protein